MLRLSEKMHPKALPLLLAKQSLTLLSFLFAHYVKELFPLPASRAESGMAVNATRLPSMYLLKVEWILV